MCATKGTGNGSGAVAPVVIIRSTLISYRPRIAGKFAAAATLATTLLASLAYWGNWKGIAPLLPAIPSKVFGEGQYWRLFTAMAIHSDPGHLGANALVLGVLVYLVHGYFGFVVYPVAGILLGALVNAVSLWTYPAGTHLLGASGLVYLLAGFWLSMYVGVDRRFGLGMRLLRATGFTLAMMVPSTIEPQVSYRTHGIGFVIGVFFGAVYFLAKRKSLRRFERVEIEEPLQEETF